jgi:preprotein translocase subunit YajC
MFISTAFAQAADGAAGGTSIFGGLLPLIIIFVIFYFLLIRPQNKRMKQHREMVAGVQRGDTVVTQGGIIGKATKVGDDEVTVEIAEGVKVKVIKSTLSDVRVKGAPATEKK